MAESTGLEPVHRYSRWRISNPLHYHSANSPSWFANIFSLSFPSRQQKNRDVYNFFIDFFRQNSKVLFKCLIIKKRIMNKKVLLCASLIMILGLWSCGVWELKKPISYTPSYQYNTEIKLPSPPYYKRKLPLLPQSDTLTISKTDNPCFIDKQKRTPKSLP